MPTINETKVVLSNTSIAYTLNELAQETTYYVRIYAKIKGEVHFLPQGLLRLILSQQIYIEIKLL